MLLYHMDSSGIVNILNRFEGHLKRMNIVFFSFGDMYENTFDQLSFKIMGVQYQVTMGGSRSAAQVL